MIKVKKDKMQIDGTAVEILAEVGVMLHEVTLKVSEQWGVSQQQLIGDVLTSIRYNNLRSSGMTDEEARDILKVERHER